MRLPEDEVARFEELDEQRRRVMDEFNLLVINMRSGLFGDYERIRMEAQHLHMRHTAIIREMSDLLR